MVSSLCEVVFCKVLDNVSSGGMFEDDSMCVVGCIFRFVSRVEEVLNDWKLIGSSVGKPPEKVG